MSGGPSFIGFEPEEKAKAMKTLDKVIELKEKNRAAAEESRGFEIAEEEKYTKRFKPLVDAIGSASGEIIKYTNEKDVKFAAREVIDAVAQFRNAQAQAAADPTNQGFVALATAYLAQANFAQSKMNFLQASEDYSKATQANRSVLLAALQKARDDYADILSKFQKTQIPIGFKQTVSIQQPPPKGSVFPGAQLEISPTPAVQAAPAPQLVAKVPPPAPAPPPPAPKLVANPNAPPPPVPKVPPPVAAPGAALVSGVNKADLTQDQEWFYDLLDEVARTGKLPAGYSKPGQRTSAGHIYYDIEADNNVSVEWVDITNTINAVGQVVYEQNTFIIEWHTVNGRSTKLAVDIWMYTASVPSPVWKDDNAVATYIGAHSIVFGGWGKDWALKSQKTNIVENKLTNSIINRANYKDIINGIVTGFPAFEKYQAKAYPPSVKNPKSKIGEGLKFKTSATPKASEMRLGPEGQYGNLIIDVQALYNDDRLIARQRGDEYGSNMGAGSPILDEVAAPNIKNLITKRAMQTTINKAPASTQKQLKRLRKLAGFTISKTTGGRKMRLPTKEEKESNVIIVGNSAELMERLKVATGVYDAGNRSKQNAQLISELATALYQQGHIKQDEFAKILGKYKAQA